MNLAYSSNAYMHCSVTEAIDCVAALGYGGFELMADIPHAWPAKTTDDQIETIRRRLDQRGLTLSNVNAFMMNAVGDFWHPSWIEPDAGVRRARVTHTIQALEMASKLGAPCITTEPGGPLAEGESREQAIDLFVAGLQEALHHAEDLGVPLLVEPEPGLLIENVEQTLALVERIDSPMFGINFDVGHMYCVAEPLPEAVQRLQGVTRHYHVEDIASSRVHRHLIPGQGAIEFDAVFRAIEHTGYQGWLTVELYPYLDDPDGAGRAARDFLTRLMPS